MHSVLRFIFVFFVILNTQVSATESEVRASIDFDNCMIEGKYIPLDENTPYKVSLILGYDAEGYDSSGFNRQIGFDFSKDVNDFTEAEFYISANPEDPNDYDYETYVGKCWSVGSDEYDAGGYSGYKEATLQFSGSKYTLVIKK